MNKARLQVLCQKRRWDLPQYRHWPVGTERDLRFLASVTVNGSVFEAPDAESRSVKEAQNKAATVAFEALSTAAPAVDVVPSPPQSPAVEPFSSLPPNTESHATYKNQLQVYAQRRGQEPPKYTTVRAGLPHALLFKATVLIDGLTFECPKYFKTVKEAEHAAAEVALASLPKEESSQQNLQDELAVPYKTLLQEFAQKNKQLLPVYTTVEDPESLLPAFSSTVEACGRTFKGEAAKTKKQAEASAAKVALDQIKERKQSQVSTSSSTSLPMNGTLISCSSGMTSKPIVSPVSLSSPMKILARDQVLPGKQSQVPSSGSTSLPMTGTLISCSSDVTSKPTVSPVKILARDQVLPGNEISATQDSEPLPAHPILEPIQLTKDCNLDPAAQSNPGLTADSIYSEEHMLTAMKEPIQPTKDCNMDLAALSNLGLTANSIYSEGHVLTAMKEPIESTKDCNLDPPAQSFLGSTANSIYSEGHVLPAMKDNNNEGVGQSLMFNKIQVFPPNLRPAIPHGGIPLHFSDDTWVAVSLDFPNHGALMLLSS